MLCYAIVRTHRLQHISTHYNTDIAIHTRVEMAGTAFNLNRFATGFNQPIWVCQGSAFWGRCKLCVPCTSLVPRIPCTRTSFDSGRPPQELQFERKTQILKGPDYDQGDGPSSRPERPTWGVNRTKIRLRQQIIRRRSWSELCEAWHANYWPLVFFTCPPLALAFHAFGYSSHREFFGSKKAAIPHKE